MSNNNIDNTIDKLAATLIKKLTDQQKIIVTAESCTGGGLSQAITAIAGSSACFQQGYVTYHNRAKQEVLSVQASTLAEHGAVSEACAKEMALGALQHSHADIAMAITGIAGPDGGSIDKPVGTVCFAWLKQQQPIHSSRQQFSGDRQQIRLQAIKLALSALNALID